MTAKEFISKTKELIPDRGKMSFVGKLESLINESQTNFLITKDTIIEEANPILWIIRNCFIKKFIIGYIYFIEDFTIERFTIVAQSEADYIGIDLATDEIYLIGYEMIDEYLNGDGTIPDFVNIYPIAQDSYKFLDALIERIKAQKLIYESPIKNMNDSISISEPFKEEATRLAGGGKYEFWRVF